MLASTRASEDTAKPVIARTASPRRMPSLDALRAFEVAARRLSFTVAADELCVTQGAVSQRIKALEAELRMPLFLRMRTGLSLTPQGEQLAHGVRQALHRIAEALDGLAPAVPAALEISGRLAISVLPSFASCWLMPRLSRFQARYPGIEVQVFADPRIIDLHGSDIDMALRFHTGAYPGLVTSRLMGDSVAPVCSPSLLARLGPIDTLEALAAAPILHDALTASDASGSGWTSWLAHAAAHGLGDASGMLLQFETGQSFNQADLTLEAAALGLGVALGRASLAGAHLASRRLVRLPFPAAPTRYAYYMVATEAAAATAVVRAMQDWLLGEAADSGW